MTKRRKISLLLNSLIVILEIIGFIVTYKIKHKVITYEYYTDLSNLLMMFTAFIFTIFLLMKKKIPRWLELLKYSSTICLTLTILVVVLVLCPMNDFNYGFMLFYKSLMCQHFLCPILSLVTFIFFDEIEITTSKENLFGISLTLLYGIIIIILNILRYVEGPYPFLLVYEQPLWQSVVWFITLLLFTYFIGFSIRKIQSKIKK